MTKGSELQLGVVYSPGREELYCAERGKGASRNGEPIHVSQRPFADGIFCTAMCTYHKEFSKVCSDIIFDVYMKCNDVRRFGSAAIELCMLASGLIDLYFEIRLQPWDYAASMLVIREAGGFVGSFDGKAPSLAKPSMVIAANSAANLDAVSSAVHAHLPQLPY